MKIYKSTFFSSLLLFLFGFHYTFIGIILLDLQREFVLSLFSTASVVSIMIVGALMGSLGGCYLADRIGRKRVLFYANGVFFLGTVLFL
ncbi:MAG: MFS transporter, partial [Chlamydiota bacterium]